MRKYTLFFAFLASSWLVVPSLPAQTSAPDPANNIPKIVPPSPNAAAIEKFIHQPVDFSTGIPSISHPLWSWNSRRLAYNLGLQYHAGGIKVEEMASNVGQGWALNAFGVVNRTTRGLPDDKPIYGYINTPPIPPFVTNLYNNQYIYVSPAPAFQQSFDNRLAITSFNSLYSNLTRQVNKSEVDGEQDVFSFSFNGNSGRFVINKNKEIVPLEHTNVKIQPQYAAALQNSSVIASFTITDEKGIVYRFTYTEYQSPQIISSSQILSAQPNLYCISSWYLTSITDPQTNEQITFNYSLNTSGIYETGFSQSEVFDITRVNDNPYLPDTIPAMQVSSDVQTYHVVGYDNPVLQSVHFPDGTTLSLTYGFPREDLRNTQALTGILVKNMYNTPVKKFRLSYSYFTCSSGSPIPYNSGNDYGKRLRLDKIEELSADEQQSKSTLFTYNSTPLNPRDSRNVDHWGYGVDPARNNGSYIPLTRMEELEWSKNPLYGMYLPGADKSPDPIFVKAGLLEKITYPTGGFTRFEYECNRAYAEGSYYEDELLSNKPVWQSNQFGHAQAVYLTDRAQEAVTFRFKADEFQPRPTPNPNAPQPCFEQSQDMAMASIEIFSTDQSFHTTIQRPYGDFWGGFKHVVQLPMGKSYQLKFLYDVSQPCGYQYAFQASAEATYLTEPRDKLVGGARIKTVVFNEGSGKTITKNYDYNLPNGRSSGSLKVVPNYHYFRSTLMQIVNITNGDGGYTSRLLGTRHVNRSSSPNYALSAHNGSSLVYTRVREIEVDGSCTEKLFDNLYGHYHPRPYPYLPYQDFPALSGLLLEQKVYDRNQVLKTRQHFTYDKQVTGLNANDDNRNLKTGIIASGNGFTADYYVADNYWPFVSYALQTGETTETYENGQVLTVTQSKTYNPQHYLSTTTRTDSKGVQKRQATAYAPDVSNVATSVMVQRNMLQYPVETTASLPQQNNGTLQQQTTLYDLYNNGMLIAPSAIRQSVRGNAPVTEISFDRYDDKGNVLQYTAKDGVIHSFLYGYQQSYPVAKIIGKRYDEVVSQSGINLSLLQAPTSDQALRTELSKLRTNLSGVQITTLTYIPQVGVTSETDLNGVTRYYEYDAFNRLRQLRDQDRNVIKVYDYQYQKPAASN